MKQWMYKKCNADTAAIAKRYNISGVFARVLVNRGLYTWKDMDAYLFPDMEKMYKPGLMKDVTKAAEILMDAIKNNVKIRVIGDYDVDGVMSSYILYRGIVMLGGEVSCRIPHRAKDGYGIRDYMVDEAKEDGIGLIITCDNGISAVSAASRAKELGITKRFVGEELLDPVTRQYNEAMKRILPNYGIEVEEIKRLETDQGIISASAVRKWIKEDNWEAVKKFVPAAVYSRLRLRSGRNNE